MGVLPSAVIRCGHAASAAFVAAALLAGVRSVPALETVEPLGSEFLVNTYTPGVQFVSGVTTGANGGFVVVWSGMTQEEPYFVGPFTIAGQRFSSTGAAVGSEFQVKTHTTDVQLGAAVGADSNGNFVVVWSSTGGDGDSGGVFGKRYSSSGAAVGSEFQINTYTTHIQSGAQVAVESDGDFVVVWSSYPISLPSGGQDGDGAGIFGQRYTSSGAVLGSEFQVNTFTTNFQNAPRVAADSDGDFVVVWRGYGQDGSYDSVFGQRYASSGDAVGSEFQINAYTTGFQSVQGVAADSDGDFVVVWRSLNYPGQDGSYSGVFAKRYASSGSALGSEFQVNSFTTGYQALGAVAADSDGDFVIVWSSEGQDGADYGVFGQRYTSGGATTGSEFRVNSYTTSVQRLPRVAATGDGVFVVVWQSDEQDGSDYGVFGQRFALSPCATSPVVGCRTAGKSLLLLRNNILDDGKDKLLWKWLKGQSVFAADFGDPETTRTYALCMYDGVGRLLRAGVPPDATKWEGLTYKDTTGSAAGLNKIRLKSSAFDNAKALVKGRGANLPDPVLGSLSVPITVQLVNDETSLCLESTFGAGDIITNEPTQFKAKASN